MRERLILTGVYRDEVTNNMLQPGDQILVIEKVENPSVRDPIKQIWGGLLYFLIFTYLTVSDLSCGTWDMCYVTQDLSLQSRGLVVALLHDPQPGIEPSSPALQGRFLTTGPPEKSLQGLIINSLLYQKTHFLGSFFCSATHIFQVYSF